MFTNSCIFCKIIDGRVKTNKVLENDKLIAIMDIRQALPGHILVIPKIHIETIFELDHETGAHMMKSIIDLSKAVKDAFDAEGLNIWQSNGKCASQEVPHLHFHIHPRKSGDGLLSMYTHKPDQPSDEVLGIYAEKIKLYL